MIFKICVTDRNYALPIESEAAFSQIPAQAVIKELKKDVVPNFFMLFQYPQYSQDNLIPNKYQVGLDKQVSKLENSSKSDSKQSKNRNNLLTSIYKSQTKAKGNIFNKQQIDSKKKE